MRMNVSSLFADLDKLSLSAQCDLIMPCHAKKMIYDFSRTLSRRKRRILHSSSRAHFPPRRAKSVCHTNDSNRHSPICCHFPTIMATTILIICALLRVASSPFQVFILDLSSVRAVKIFRTPHYFLTLFTPIFERARCRIKLLSLYVISKAFRLLQNCHSINSSRHHPR